MSTTDQLLSNNSSYADGFAIAELPAAPRLRVAIVACMDARLDPARALGFVEGDAHVIRNAGGVVTEDVIRSLAISQHHLGTEEIVFLHHTRCGMQSFTDEGFRPAGLQPPWPARTFTDLDADVRESIRLVLESPYIERKGSVRGFVYEVETGRVREVV